MTLVAQAWVYYIMGANGRQKIIVQYGGDIWCQHTDVINGMRGSFGGGGSCLECDALFASFDCHHIPEDSPEEICLAPM
jgi:hypothetical protein